MFIQLAAKLAVTTLLVLAMLLIGCVELNPGPDSTNGSDTKMKTTATTLTQEQPSETDRILTAIADLQRSQTDMSANMADRMSTMEQTTD